MQCDSRGATRESAAAIAPGFLPRVDSRVARQGGGIVKCEAKKERSAGKGDERDGEGILLSLL